MAPPKKLFLLDSVIISFFVNRYASTYSLGGSFFWTASALYTFQLLVLATYEIILYPHFLSPLRHIPTPPGANILLGHFPRMFREPTGFPQREWIESVPNDGLIRYTTLWNEERLLITSPKAMAEVLVHRNYDFIKPIRFREGLGRVLGIGILLAEGDEHKRQRKLLMPAFAFRHIKDLYSVFWAKSREMVVGIDDSIKKPTAPSEKTSNVVEFGNWASRATLDIIGLAGLGRDFHALDDPDNELNQTYRTIFTSNRLARIMQILGNFIPIWFLRLLPVKRNEELSNAIKLIKSTCWDLVRTKRQSVEKGERTEHDILSVALESGGFSDEDLVNQLMTFLAAGHETTASALMWAIYLLCTNPDVQEKLREEVRGALPSVMDKDAKVSSTDIDHLAYLNAVINETMRVYPPVPLTLRNTAQDTTLLGQFVPKDTIIIICPWAVNVSEKLWGADAKVFDPERWMGPGKANSGGASSNFDYLTFLHGPRSCIGKDFSKAEFACLLAAVVGHFEMELDNPALKLDISNGVTAKPKGGLLVKFKALEGW
ncbi:cytochrome P450 [Lophium mytilinum]|uniref:Cytochrome P450 n=1 Tax=Lophium mytilinum TaxID=390894 RepID=A0A6A6QRJ5_9PEZI|nr:cytochrome P450 [Lophium mytilinum]